MGRRASQAEGIATIGNRRGASVPEIPKVEDGIEDGRRIAWLGAPRIDAVQIESRTAMGHRIADYTAFFRFVFVTRADKTAREYAL